LLDRREEVPESVKDLLLLKSLRAVGEVAVLTQALEVGQPQRFTSIGRSQPNPTRQIRETVTSSIFALQETLPLGPGRGLFFLDKPLS
jgi:hypothetical protein